MAPYDQCYKKSWESFPELKDWLRPVEKDNKKAFCMFCKCEVNAKLSDLKRHAETKKHVKATDPFSSIRQTKLSFPKVSEKLSVASSEVEGHIALLVEEELI